MDYPRYDARSAITPLTPDEIDGLDHLLQSLDADGVMSLDGVDGYLTALVLGPREIVDSWPTADWLPLAWGGDGPLGHDGAAPFASKRQRKATVVLLLRHLRHLAAQLARGDGADPAAADGEWEPIFSIAEQGDREWADARDWCTGFLQGVDLRPEAWGVDWTDPALAGLLALGGGLDGVRSDAAPDDAEAIDALSRTVPDAVLRLRAR